MMHYAGMILGTLLWAVAFGCCVLLVSGGLRKPGVRRLLAAMRNATWFAGGAVVVTEIWFVSTRIVRPDLWENEVLPLPVVMLVVAAFFGFVGLALMVICNARLTFALLRMRRAGQVIEWESEAAAVARWCRRFGILHRAICRWNGIELSELLGSTLCRHSHGNGKTTQNWMAPGDTL